jgi:LmbE family N-acetylglucosaminyl deacetylase
MQPTVGALFAPGAQALILQPHYDDAALSCGGAAARFAQLGRANILTVFASELVPAMVGEFAAWKHERWKIDDSDQLVAERRAEDARAAAVLGCHLRWLGPARRHLPRRHYRSDAELFGPLHPDEDALAEHLAEEVSHLPEWSPGATVLVPLGVGQHVDHQLVFETGRILARGGARVLAYEDTTPYVIHTPASLARRLAQVGDALEAPVLAPIAEVLDTKIQAIGCYASQLPVIFRFTADYAAAVRVLAAERGGALGRAERLWPLKTGSAAGARALTR